MAKITLHDLINIKNMLDEHDQGNVRLFVECFKDISPHIAKKAEEEERLPDFAVAGANVWKTLDTYFSWLMPVHRNPALEPDQVIFSWMPNRIDVSSFTIKL